MATKNKLPRFLVAAIFVQGNLSLHNKLLTEIIGLYKKSYPNILNL